MAKMGRPSKNLLKRIQISPEAQSLENLVQYAFEQGLPPDTLERFLLAGYCPQHKQVLFHAAARSADSLSGPIHIGFGGSRGSGKTVCVLAQLAIDDCQRQPELKCLFLRKVGKAARESFEDIRRQILREVPHEYKSHHGVMEFPNGSRLILGHFNADKDIDAYLGLEYDVIAIEENTQLSEEKVKDLNTCLRTSKPTWRPRTYRTTNPGGISHGSFRSTFILPWRNDTETTTKFIPATVRDNAFINPEYRASLESLTGWKRAAWLDGEWDLAAGMYFSMWNYSVHTCDPFPIPTHWPVWAAMDYGFRHPTGVLLLTEYDGIIYAIAEHCQSNRLPKQHAESIKSLFARQGVRFNPMTRQFDRISHFFAGTDVFAQRGDSEARTIAQQYAAEGIDLVPASMDRVNGWGEILKRLGDPDEGIPPTLKIFRTCTRLIETLPFLQHDPKHPEDVLKVDISEDGSGGDDMPDVLRYSVGKGSQNIWTQPLYGGTRNKMTPVKGFSFT